MLQHSFRPTYAAMTTALGLPTIRRISAVQVLYRGADKSLARLTSRCTLFDGKNISFDASLVIYI